MKSNRSWIDRIAGKLKSEGAAAVPRALVDFVASRFESRAESAFDRKYGTDTQGILDDMRALGVVSDHAADAYGYQGIQSKDFTRVLRRLDVDPVRTAFVDFGSGKGRAVLLAAEHGFAEVHGVEHSPVLHAIAQSNADIFRRTYTGRSHIHLHCDDATRFALPHKDLVCFFYNPFGPNVLERVCAAIKASLDDAPRRLWIVYRNPVHRGVFDNAGFVHPLDSPKGYMVYRSTRQQATADPVSG